jgi:hypothetical protein
VRRLVSVVVPLALSLSAGPAAAQPHAPAKYAAGQRCEDAMEQGRALIRDLPASRAAWNGDATLSLRAFNGVFEQARRGRLTCDAAFSDAGAHDDVAEQARLRTAWSSYMTEVDRALALITHDDRANN